MAQNTNDNKVGNKVIHDVGTEGVVLIWIKIPNTRAWDITTEIVVPNWKIWNVLQKINPSFPFKSGTRKAERKLTLIPEFNSASGTSKVTQNSMDSLNIFCGLKQMFKL